MDNLSAKTKPIRERPDNKVTHASPHARDTPSNATRPFPHPATRKGPPSHEGTAGLVNDERELGTLDRNGDVLSRAVPSDRQVDRVARLVAAHIADELLGAGDFLAFNLEDDVAGA